MKLNKIILSVVACTLALGSCDDNKMEWGRPDGYGDVDISDIPLALKEQIANYDYIKNYAAQYMPNSTIGIGLGADLYISDATYKQVADDNFQLITLGNAMKHASVVKTNGDLDFTTIDAFFNIVPADMKVYGHNLLWHTQQKQAYLKSLIAPTMEVEVSEDDVCENIVNNSDFEGGSAEGWTGLWGKYTYAVEGPGHNSDYALHFTMTEETAANYDCQLFWPIDLVVGETYAYSFWVKSDANIDVQFIGQNASYAGIYKDIFTAPAEWMLCTGEFTYSETEEKDVCRVGIQFGGTPGSNVWVDDFKFGKKIEDTMINILGDTGKFEDGKADSFSCWGDNNPSKTVSEKGEGYKSDYCMVLTNPVEGGSGNDWKAQCAYTLDDGEFLSMDKTYVLQFMAKSNSAVGTLQFQYQNGTHYGSQGGYHSFDVGTEWIQCEVEFTPGYEDVNRILINFGAVEAVYYIDNVKFGEKKASEKAVKSKATRAGGITYIPMSPEKKAEALLGAMEAWIKGIMEHCGDRVMAWDVINEPISDNCQWRGVGGNFMSNGADEEPDREPVESPETGLSLNWANEHFYWGYYLGKDYAVKAFEYARKYAPAGTKLFVNDYNLETSPNKLAALIEFVNYIEEHGQTVDGIGTQMHVRPTITREEIDAMFKTMAQTGKLVRVTELDVALGSANPSAEEFASQAETYQMIFESYKANVPEAQQSGITIWTLTDDPREHTYWLPDESPNLFDKSYGRKHAYKGVCDGIAGKNIGEEFTGDMWKNTNGSTSAE